MPKEFEKNQLKGIKLKKDDVIFRSCDEGLMAIICEGKNYEECFPQCILQA